MRYLNKADHIITVIEPRPGRYEISLVDPATGIFTKLRETEEFLYRENAYSELKKIASSNQWQPHKDDVCDSAKKNIMNLSICAHVSRNDCHDAVCCLSCPDKEECTEHCCFYFIGETKLETTEKNTDDQAQSAAQAPIDIEAVKQKTKQLEKRSEAELIADVYRMIGRIETGQFISKFVDVTTLHLYMQVKESKIYKDIPNIKTWDGFCRQIVGCSRQKVDDDLKNLEVLGAEFYELSNNLGIGYRDLRKLRSLPDSDRKALLAQLESREDVDKGELLDLLEKSYQESDQFRAAAEKAEGDMLNQKDDMAQQISELTDERDLFKKHVMENMDPAGYLERVRKIDKHLVDSAKLLNTLPVEAIKEDLQLRVQVNAKVMEMQAIVEELNGLIQEANEEN